MRYGGISSGPESGYYQKLHGTEAVVPLKGGAIPVKMQGGGMELHFHGMIIDKNACMEFAEMLYPYTKKLEAWGH
jgi:hypothetical protein